MARKVIITVLVVISLLILFHAAFADPPSDLMWQDVGIKDNTDATVLLSTNNIDTNGSQISGWVAFIRSKYREVGHVIIDCENRRYRLTENYKISLKGQILQQYNKPENWHPIIKGSVAFSVSERLCPFAKDADQAKEPTVKERVPQDRPQQGEPQDKPQQQDKHQGTEEPKKEAPTEQPQEQQSPEKGKGTSV